MHKKLLFLSFAHIICWVNLFYLAKTEFLPINTLAIAQAQTQPPDPFLGAVYYGQETIINVLDHEFPQFGGDGELNVHVMHYDGMPYGNNGTEIPSGYGYDAHVGVDYALKYQPVLAAATGRVAVADWSKKDDHRALYGLHVRMIHDANPNYLVWYGHLSTLTVQKDDRIILSDILDNDR
ncbi:MAG: M23 family metallopeptidase [Chloroflexota bacterium]